MRPAGAGELFRQRLQGRAAASRIDHAADSSFVAQHQLGIARLATRELRGRAERIGEGA